jgi:hypothetical protein
LIRPIDDLLYAKDKNDRFIRDKNNQRVNNKKLDKGTRREITFLKNVAMWAKELQNQEVDIMQRSASVEKYVKYLNISGGTQSREAREARKMLRMYRQGSLLPDLRAQNDAFAKRWTEIKPQVAANNPLFAEKIETLVNRLPMTMQALMIKVRSIDPQLMQD